MQGCEWIVDAKGCSPAALRSLEKLQALLRHLVEELPLHPVADAQWHTFPGEGGVTGLCLLAESHFAVHTFPEHGFAALSVYSCRPREAPDFEALLQRHLEPSRVTVRTVVREARA